MEKCDQCGAEGQGLTMQHGTNCPKQPLGVGQPQMRGAWSNADSGAYGSKYQGQACDTPPNEPVAASETVTAADGNVWRNVKFGKPMLDAIVDVIYDDGRQVRGAVAASLFWVGVTHWRLSELPAMTTAVEAPGLFADMSVNDPRFPLNNYVEQMLDGNNEPGMQQSTEMLLVKAGFAKDIAIRVATRIGMQDDETRLRGQRGAELLAAEATLHRMGYTWEGGGEWKPSLGKAPAQYAPDSASGGGKLKGDHYYRVDVASPISPELVPYSAECADIIEALQMTFNEGEAFKALWRLAAARLGKGKPGSKAQYDADKVAHYGARVAAHSPKIGGK